MKLKQHVLIWLALPALVFSLNCCNQPKKETNQETVTVNPSETKERTFLKFSSGIRSILEDSKGNIWFGSHQEGVAKFDGSTYTYFTTEDGLSHNQVRNIYEGKNGTIWFECGQGISGYNGGLINSTVNKNYTSIDDWSLNESDLWFKGDEMTGFNATEGQPGVYQYNGQQFWFRALPVEVAPGEENYYSTTTPFVKSKDGKIWMGTYGAAIGYDGSDFTIIDNKNLGYTDESGFLHIRSLLADSKGNIWIGNNGIGVLKFDGKTTINFTDRHDLLLSNFNNASLKKIFSIGEDASGNIWFGTSGSGAWRYDGDSLSNYNKTDGLAGEHIWAIYLSNQDELWFATANPSGVYAYTDRKFERRF